MSAKQDKELAIVSRFQELLRSGKDYKVRYMYTESGKIAYITASAAKRIINNHYQRIVTDDMIDLLRSLAGRHQHKVRTFAKKYNLCERESRLLIRYIKRHNGYKK